MCGFISGPFILLVCVFVLSITHCSDYYSFVIESGIREHEVSSSVVLSGDCFGYLGFTVEPYTF